MIKHASNSVSIPRLLKTRVAQIALNKIFFITFYYSQKALLNPLSRTMPLIIQMRYAFKQE